MDRRSIAYLSPQIFKPIFRQVINLRERLAATAGLVCIWVGELEAATNQRIAVVKHQPIEVKHTLGIADNLKAFVVEHFVIFADIANLFKVHCVGHP